jgi:hypothetical protein
MEEAANSSGNKILPVQLHQPGPNSGKKLQARSSSNGALQFQVSSANHSNLRSK